MTLCAQLSTYLWCKILKYYILMKNSKANGLGNWNDTYDFQSSLKISN